MWARLPDLHHSPIDWNLGTQCQSLCLPHSRQVRRGSAPATPSRVDRCIECTSSPLTGRQDHIGARVNEEHDVRERNDATCLIHSVASHFCLGRKREKRWSSEGHHIGYTMSMRYAHMESGSMHWTCIQKSSLLDRRTQPNALPPSTPRNCAQMVIK